jgi:hypothetical protein
MRDLLDDLDEPDLGRAQAVRVPDPDLEVCDCGGPLTFDATSVGKTCGGLELVGWLACACGKAYLSSKSRPAEVWTLAKSGTSINAAGTRIRAERTGDVAALMARIVRLPELEREVAALRAENERLHQAEIDRVRQ